jgi:hypothetical protein
VALLTVQRIARTAAALAPTYSAVSASDTFSPGAGVFLHVKNASGVSTTVALAITPPGPIDDVTYKQSSSFTITAGAEKMMGPFPASFYADPVTGLATVTFSATTSVTVAAINCPQP